MNPRFFVEKSAAHYHVIDTYHLVGFNRDEVDDEYVMAACGVEEDALLIAFSLNLIGETLVKTPLIQRGYPPDN